MPRLDPHSRFARSVPSWPTTGPRCQRVWHSVSVVWHQHLGFQALPVQLDDCRCVTTILYYYLYLCCTTRLTDSPSRYALRALIIRQEPSAARRTGWLLGRQPHRVVFRAFSLASPTTGHRATTRDGQCWHRLTGKPCRVLVLDQKRYFPP